MPTSVGGFWAAWWFWVVAGFLSGTPMILPGPICTEQGSLAWEGWSGSPIPDLVAALPLLALSAPGSPHLSQHLGSCRLLALGSRVLPSSLKELLHFRGPHVLLPFSIRSCAARWKSGHWTLAPRGLL